MRQIKILADERSAEALSDMLMDAGALSATIEDADAESTDEKPLYGEPGLEPDNCAWPRSIVSILADDDFDLEEETKLCPVCKRNYIPIEEEMCDSCLRAMENKDPLENDDSWVEFIDDDPLEKDIVEIPLEELQDEEFADDEEEAEEETEEYKDDFEDDFKFDDKFEYDDDDIDEDEDDELDEDE